MSRERVDTDAQPDDLVQPICVIGAGTMGRGIAQVALSHGHPVSLVDPNPGQLDAAVAEIRTRLARRQPTVAETLGDRLVAVTSIGEAPARPGTVLIEAVVEDLETKATVFGQALEHFGDDCVLATNTSSLSVTAIAARTLAPERVVGMHFFNPVPVMRLVEVVVGLQTDPAVADRIGALADAWGKKVARVRSAPGFIVNRVARPFYGEALKLLEEGATDAQTIDELLRSAGGFRMGPFELMDLIGTEVNLKVTQTVWRAFDFDPRFAPSRVQSELVAAGRYGRKTGQGFFPYGSATSPPSLAPVTGTWPADGEITLHGESTQLTELLARAGVDYVLGDRCIEDDIDLDDTPRMVLGGLGQVLLTRGRTAQQEAQQAGAAVAVLDRCLDPGSTQALAVAATDDNLLGAVAGLLDRAGIAIYRVADTPGLVVARIVAMIINEAAEASLHQVATPDDIDIAMTLGTNYPLGPFAWAQRWTPAAVLELLDELNTEYRDPRYRASQQLRAITRAECAQC